MFFLLVFVFGKFCVEVCGGGIYLEGFISCIGNIFYIGDLSIISNGVFEWSRLVLARNFADHFPDCVCFGGRIKFVDIILPTDLFSLFNGFPCLCSEKFKRV